MSKKTKALLAILIALLVLLLAGGAILWQTNYFAKPAAPDNSWTLRNVTLDLGEDEIALAPEANLRAVKNEDQIAVEFDVNLNGRTLMPVRGEISEEGVSFALGDSGRVYTADIETLTELLGVEASDTQVLENLKEMVQSYAALAQKSSDQKYLSKYADVYGEMYEIMLNTSAEDVKVEVDGKEYSGRRYAGKMNGESLAALLNYMQNCEIDELANMMNGLLELVSLTGDQEYESYDDLLADAGAAIDADVELTVVLNGKLNYQKMVMQQEGVNGMAVQSDMESVTDKKGTRVTMIQTMGDPQTNGTVQNISCELTGPVNAPEALHFDMDYESVTDASDDDYQYVTTMTMAMDGAQTDGLWNVTADANVAMDITYGEAGEEEQYSSEIGINADYAETAEEDGGVNGAFTLSIDDGAEDYGLSFELCRRKDAVIEALVEEDTELSELSADMTDAVYTQLGADAMAFVADAAELTADESVAALVELFTPNYEEAADAYDEEELEDEVSQQVGSIEEAAAIYASEIPEYTAPEGYELSVVNVTSTDMEAIYTNGESEFTFYLLDFGADMGMEPEITYGDDNEGGVFYAEVMLGSSYISFSFENGTTRAEAEAITAGLNL